MEKPNVLYHASSNKDIEVFEPRANGVRDMSEGPVVFATPDKAFASIFLVKTNGKWAKISRWTSNGVTTPWHLIVKGKRKFKRRDHGGAIYHLPSESFTFDPDKGVGGSEWTSRSEIRPSGKDLYDSGFRAMIDYGVEVYFVGRLTFRKIKRSEDHGYEIVSKLKKEQ
ncbi:MAG: hypothetical protein H6799_01205 [Candidatus Nomurabacteria bacterium]|nr:MAG: hypothetical protein H6799_01205 [Candidatus Nomurabacteria bacterium]HRV76345.1 hypothetical protein [Candidatus Saccharimonadales bacterium]